MSENIIVNKLSVNAVTGKASDDPYGQGFASIYAEALVTDPNIREQLNHFKEKNISVTFQCAALRVSGIITKINNSGKESKVTISVQDIVKEKPKETLVQWKKSST